ncbi:universal stress protein family [Liquorilactobacillus sucicola DSM 21376 = JCM 15457]|uniref:Universal stress protein UspA n=1 Tax=Liquorilactobacillus sucicola DSM 21376 = JCM 15457 TaxID=1423806 RepID=A0A023CUG9_9LACO|nr:universal stress protein [Liquorilactobacillus sucicola]KRN05470.1 universal stress protein UspA [Liquorilactobacillus sucicola DSM 21376 = JCM 15457]GAJ25548.1 universal stress protein family [Liquorilactobacillus sucicola DSM 21376 = JCM 15457]
MAYKRILVGLDGSKQADLAFAAATDLARVFSAKLYLLWVVNRDRGMDLSFRVSDDFYQDQARKAEEDIKKYVNKAEKSGTDVTGTVIIGNTKTILATSFPQENDIDLIVLGDTGLNALEKVVVGSHTSYVLRNSNCAVLVVK